MTWPEFLAAFATVPGNYAAFTVGPDGTGEMYLDGMFTLTAHQVALLRKEKDVEEF